MLSEELSWNCTARRLVERLNRGDELRLLSSGWYRLYRPYTAAPWRPWCPGCVRPYRPYTAAPLPIRLLGLALHYLRTVEAFILDQPGLRREEVSESHSTSKRVLIPISTLHTACDVMRFEVPNNCCGGLLEQFRRP